MGNVWVARLHVHLENGWMDRAEIFRLGPIFLAPIYNEAFSSIASHARLAKAPMYGFGTFPKCSHVFQLGLESV